MPRQALELMPSVRQHSSWSTHSLCAQQSPHTLLQQLQPSPHIPSQQSLCGSLSSEHESDEWATVDDWVHDVPEIAPQFALSQS